MKRHLEFADAARFVVLMLISGMALPQLATAAPVSLATAPLANSTTTAVKPNLLFVLDNSGSMDWDHMPDDSTDGGSAVSFKYGYYGLRSSQCNQVYYDPATTYQPPVHADGTNYPDSSFTAAWIDGYNTGSGTVDLSASFKASQSLNGDGTGGPAYYYKYTGTQTSPSQKNYNSTTNTFYSECNSALNAAPGNAVFTKVVVSATSGPGGVDERTNFANWYSYYRTRMLMMKTAAGRAFSSLNNSYRVGLMKISQTNPAVNMGVFENTQRTNWYNTLYGMAVSGSTPTRRALSDAGRYYAGKLSVTDPVEYSCQQNFTIMATDGYWNSGDSYKLDGTTIVDNQDGTADRPMYDGSQSGTTVTITYTRNSYSKVSTGCSGSKRALKTQPQIGTCSVTVAGTPTGSETCTPTAWSNNGAATLGSCVSTVTLPSPNPSASVVNSRTTTTGSYGGTSNNLADVAMYYYQTDLRTSALGNCTGALGAGTDVCENNVFRSGSDNNLQQHMTTFTLGLGASGWMTYSPSYLTDTAGDYVSVKLGSPASSTVCTWQTAGTICNWPVPGMSGSDGYIANIDDLWHAAVNGRGAYFSATNPASLAAGLSNALTGINSRKGAAAAAATSTLNPVAGNNLAFIASYTTVAWKGNLEARGINVNTGAVSANATWCAENVVAGSCPAPGAVVADTSGATTAYNCVTPNSVTCINGTLIGTDCYVPVATACTGTMNAMVTDTTDIRNIYTANSTGTALTPFDATYATANPANFSAAHISGLSQWTTLTATQQAAATGVNLINFLRGQHGFEDRTTNLVANRLYRAREAVLGDALESQPAFIGAPVFSYPYTGYTAFKTAQANRAGTVFLGANDGMLHAFASDTGIERWAYVPSMVIPNMWKLADKNYATSHVNFVNGSPSTSDIYCPGNCGGVTDVAYGASASWRTILVASLNGGGRGYYALDITNPNAPTLMWEFTPTGGTGRIQDDDVGYGFGMPVITRKRDGTWVVLVASGYNNTSPGTGRGYLYVLNANTGAIISKIDTGVGSTTTPSGLAKVDGWNVEPSGNLAGYVYGGDLQGNVWRFDINSSTAAAIGTGSVMRFAQLYSDAAGTSPQPVTTTPVLAQVAGKRVVIVATGKYLETGDLTTTQKQTVYAIKDDNATATLVNPRTTLVQQTLSLNPNGTGTRLASNNAVNFFTQNGWYVDLPDSGERVNIDPKLVSGTLMVASLVPSNTACAPGGYGWLNYLNYRTGGAVKVTNLGGSGLGSSKNDSTIVGLNYIFLNGKPLAGSVSSDRPDVNWDPNIPFEPPGGEFVGKRVIWRELIP